MMAAVVAHILSDKTAINKADLVEAMDEIRRDMDVEFQARIDYPWFRHEEIVLEHIQNSNEKHENDRTKRERIRQELYPIEVRLERIEKALERSMVIPRVTTEPHE